MQIGLWTHQIYTKFDTQKDKKRAHIPPTLHMEKSLWDRALPTTQKIHPIWTDPYAQLKTKIMHICRNWSLLMEKGLFLLQTKKIKYRSLSSNVNRSNNNHMKKFSNPQNSQSSHHTQLHRNLSKNTTLLVWILFIVSTHNQFTQINTKI